MTTNVSLQKCYAAEMSRMKIWTGIWAFLSFHFISFSSYSMVQILQSRESQGINTFLIKKNSYFSSPLNFSYEAFISHGALIRLVRSQIPAIRILLQQVSYCWITIEWQMWERVLASWLIGYPTFFAKPRENENFMLDLISCWEYNTKDFFQGNYHKIKTKWISCVVLLLNLLRHREDCALC